MKGLEIQVYKYFNKGLLWGCCGCYVRNFAVLTRIISLLLLLLIGVLAILLITNKNCKDAVHKYVVDFVEYEQPGAMYDAGIMLVIVDLGFWGASHCLIPLLKLIIDQEAFLYEPFDRDRSLAYYVCCQMLGP